MSPKPRKMVVMAKGNARELVNMVEPRDLSRSQGNHVSEITKGGSLEQEIEAMLKAIDTGGFQGNYPHGFALAHHQINQNHFRVFVVRSDVAQERFGGHRVFINPKVVSFDGGEMMEVREGCLSHPFRGTRKLQRWDRIRAEWQDIKGEKHEATLYGLAAQVFQHEFDHCEGKTVWMDVV